MDKPKIPEMTPIQSSMLEGHAYDQETRTMHVKYKNGATYAYDDVPLEKYAAFTGAESPGRYFNANIRGQGGRKVG